MRRKCWKRRGDFDAARFGKYEPGFACWSSNMISLAMHISLSPEQEVWLGARVASGEFATIEEGVRRLIDEAIAIHSGFDDDDLSWAKPLVDEGLAAIARGEVVTLEEHLAHNARLRESIGG